MGRSSLNPCLAAATGSAGCELQDLHSSDPRLTWGAPSAPNSESKTSSSTGSVSAVVRALFEDSYAGALPLDGAGFC